MDSLFSRACFFMCVHENLLDVSISRAGGAKSEHEKESYSPNSRVGGAKSEHEKELYSPDSRAGGAGIWGGWHRKIEKGRNAMPKRIFFVFCCKYLASRNAAEENRDAKLALSG